MDEIDDILSEKPPDNSDLGDTLTEAQKERMDLLWKASRLPPSLKELVAAAAGRKNVDTRTKFGRAVRDYLAGKGFKYRVEQDYVRNSVRAGLTDEDKEYIRNNCDMMSSVEMARVIFKNLKLTNTTVETRAVADYLKTLDFRKPYEDPDNVPTREYRPPNTLDRICAAVNRVVNPPVAYDYRVLSPRLKKEMQILMNYLRIFRFIHLMNSFEKQEDRDLFESSFIRYTYDKPDLTEEEVDQYMSLCVDVVLSASIQRRAEKLRVLLDQAADAADVDKQKFSISLVDAIEKMQSEYHQCQTRMKNLLSDLKGKRSERLNGQLKDNASILNLVQCWKDEETRKKMIAIAEKRKDRVKEGWNELASMEDLVARMMGLTQEEVYDG